MVESSKKPLFYAGFCDIMFLSDSSIVSKEEVFSDAGFKAYYCKEHSVASP